jgi:hypothetical protein
MAAAKSPAASRFFSPISERIRTTREQIFVPEDETLQAKKSETLFAVAPNVAAITDLSNRRDFPQHHISRSDGHVLSLIVLKWSKSAMIDRTGWPMRATR